MENQMRDCAGEPLAVGDIVAVQMLGYKQLTPMVISGFTKCKVRVKYIALRTGAYDGRLVDPHRLAKLFSQNANNC